MSSADPRTVVAPPLEGGTSTPLLRWSPLVLFGLMLVALARHAAAGISDPDTLWHILAGEHLWATHELAGPDPLSRFTTQPWVLNQWLPELGMALANHLGGLAAVTWTAHVARILVCLTIFVACRSVAGPLAASVVASAGVLGTADSLSPRPQLVGFILLGVVVLTWHRTLRDGRPRWWLLAVMWLWACSHGTWVAGVSVGAAAVVGLALDRRWPRNQLVRLAGVVVGGALGTVATPLGPRLYESFATVRAVSPYIAEWRLPTLSSPSVLITLGLAVAVPLLWVAARRRPGWAHVLLWAVGVGWASSSMRTVAIGAIILAPLAAQALDQGVGRARPKAGRAEVALVGAAALLSVVLAAVLAAAGPKEPQQVPTAFDTQLASLPAGTVVWNSDTLGGWLMWSHPELEHTADTRAELYGPAKARDYLAVIAAVPGWESRFDALHPTVVVVDEGAGLVGALERRGWRIAARDAGYALLRRGTAG
ncbi:hypothetical protein ABEG17_03100 [Pedococcus sp. KACC 23699]|uniref:Glycosyltransferase RgtA/B/C/D-like domain-containing protein n=1 Tax=Pedococcus sp. KACC 23699 TaxID=3149228 RepID=A0AAU7JVN0_9MICO